MYRGLILGGLAFVAFFTAERQLAPLGKDIARYNKMREMSGDPPLLRQGLGMLRDVAKSYGGSRRGNALGLADALKNDLIRYARISTM